MPPIWLDEYGHRVPTRKCARPGCGREYPVRRYRYDTLRLIGWPLLGVGITSVAVGTIVLAVRGARRH